MKRLVIFAMAVLAAAGLYAAEPEKVQPIEVEGRVGISVGLGKYHGSDNEGSATMGFEVRYNIPSTAWDGGIAIDLTTAPYNYTFDVPDKGVFKFQQKNRTLGIAFTGDYNFGQGRKINPFVGGMAGMAYHDVIEDAVYYSRKGWTGLYSPRVGVELFRHLRVTATFNMSRKGFNTFYLSVGGVIGGRPRTAK